MGEVGEVFELETRREDMKTKNTKTARVQARITESLKARLKQHCAKRNISITDFIESLLSKSLKRN